MTSKVEDVLRSEAQQALDKNQDLLCEGFDASRVFALTRQVIENPPAGSNINKRRLIRRVGAIFLFIVHPTTPLDPSNPRTKPVSSSAETAGGGAIRPAYWYIDLRKTGRVGRGQPPKTILGRKRKADVVIECRDRDVVDIATGRTFASKVYNNGRMKIKGSLDAAMGVADLFMHERSKIFGTPAIKPSAAQGLTAGQEPTDYEGGSPAPVTADIRSRL